MDENKRTPALRFRGFSGNWEERSWVETVNISTNMVDPKTHLYDYLPHVAPGNIESFTGRILDNVKLVKDENLISGKFKFDARDIIYGKINPQLGKYVYATFSGLTSADAYVLNAKNGLAQKFLFSILQTQNFFDYSVAVSKRSGMPKINRDELNAYTFLSPSYDEQDKIGDFLLNFDKLISLHQKKHTQLIAIKKAMLEKMFSKEGETIPEIRFAGFTEPWKQYKFSNLVQIERGGSPRPIDDYITESPDGLNWVKIGDAPELGHYIIKTAEKIRPEGLQKTREVHPGDLILSNSMSFGRPYIMGIDGCIHDGWLLIRDTKDKFNLIFLCHLLSTPQIVEQYKSLAAGSTVNNLNKELVGNTIIMIPQKSEQKIIGQYFEKLDNLITLHQKKIDQLQHIKKAFLDKMFV